MASPRKPDEPSYYDRTVLERVDYALPRGPWARTQVSFQPGGYLHPAKPKNLESLGLANAHPWSPLDADWKLPEDWKRIVLDGLRERLEGSRTLCIFM